MVLSYQAAEVYLIRGFLWGGRRIGGPDSLIAKFFSQGRRGAMHALSCVARALRRDDG